MRRKLMLTNCFVLACILLQGLAFGARNPLASWDQLYSEEIASYIVSTPEVQTAADTLAQKWPTLMGVTIATEQQAYIQDAVTEFVFWAALGAQTPLNYPKFISMSAPPHSWYGMNVSGSRMLLDNPDTVYRSVLVDPSASYIISGKRHKPSPVDENYSLLDNKGVTTQNIAVNKLVVNKDGSFEITMDSSPANGRVNHIQTTPTSNVLICRNTVNDWATQNYNRLSIKRVDGPALPAPPNFDDLVNATVASITANERQISYWYSVGNAAPLNSVGTVTHGGGSTLLSTQAQSFFQFSLADDEALVYTVNLGGAKYFTVPLYTQGTISADYVHHTQCMNNAQALPNKDGTYTFVISVKDPGVYNWVDTVGMHEGYSNPRWQVLPAKAPKSGDVAHSMQVVKLADLKKVLPKHTKYVTAKERKKQLKQRAAAFSRRYAELYKY